MSTAMSTAKPGFHKKQIQIEIELLKEIEQVAVEQFGEKIHPGNTSPPITKALNEIIRIGLKHLNNDPIQNLSLQNNEISIQYKLSIKELKNQIQNQDLNLLSINSKIEDIESQFKCFSKHLSSGISTRLGHLENLVERLYREESNQSTANLSDRSTAQSTGRSTANLSDESTGQSTDRSTANSSDRSTAQSTDKSTANLSDRSTAQSTDESTANLSDRSTANSENESTGQSTAESTANSENESTGQIVSKAQLARILGITKSTVGRWHKAGKFPPRMAHLAKKYQPISKGWLVLNDN